MRRTTIILSSIGGVIILLVVGWLVYQQGLYHAPAPPRQETGNQPAQLTRHTYVSQKGVQVTIDQWADNMLVTSPQTITGSIPGNWSFEASFPVELRDATGKTVVQTPAHLTGDWMTTQPVPFTVTLRFAQPSSSTGMLRLHKDNPSGLPENADTIDIPVRFQATSY